jgi:hypothetical protein
VPARRAVRTAAISFLVDAYEGIRVRAGKGVPHAQAVADILREAGADERTQVAALLHDVVEDTPRDIDDVRAAFGDELAAIVDALTEDRTIERYAQRKRALRGRIGAASQPGVIDIAVADKIATLRHAAMTGDADLASQARALPDDAAARACGGGRAGAHRRAHAALAHAARLAVGCLACACRARWHTYAMVPTDAPGVVIEDDWDALGMRTSGSNPCPSGTVELLRSADVDPDLDVGVIRGFVPPSLPQMTPLHSAWSLEDLFDGLDVGDGLGGRVAADTMARVAAGHDGHSEPGLSLHPAAGDGIEERRVVALVLVGVGLGERRDRAIERVARAEVAGDGDRIARARVSARQRPRAQPRVEAQVRRPHRANVG